ncbi:MAG: N(4)-(beta-N-acetylglucosaminyl)-L-asparaginase [Bacillota bacterium]|nr:N(4)-(beta-N-acetylglucosaminyl)-L-asparaginase [Bacillota bacterium]
MDWCIIATWYFSLEGIRWAKEHLSTSNGCALDAVTGVASMVEDDPEVDSVGLGGLPNRNGDVELDAAIMDGRDLSIGAVASLTGFRNPVMIARHVLQQAPHHFLVGQGAEAYADALGMERACLLTEKSRQAWEQKRAELAEDEPEPEGHDTVGIVALDLAGDMAAATSTSGISFKLHGRVGDSPLVGSGYYVDNDVGGAAATGLGEDIMKGCTCYSAVELMRQGRSPQEAAEEAIQKTHNRLLRTRSKVGNMAIVCMDRQGRYGAAANHDDFTFVVATPEIEPVVRQAVRTV